MAIKTGWVIGDTAFIPDDGGSSGGGNVFVVDVENIDGEIVMTKTYREIYEATNTMPVLLHLFQGTGIIAEFYSSHNLYKIKVAAAGSQSGSSGDSVSWTLLNFQTTTQDGYPKFTQ